MPLRPVGRRRLLVAGALGALLVSMLVAAGGGASAAAGAAGATPAAGTLTTGATPAAAPQARAAAPDARTAAPDPLALLALQQARFTDGQPGRYEDFGCAVALDGDTALVGAGGSMVSGLPYAGAAYVYVRAGGVWSLQGQLSCPQPAAGDQFGGAVALDGDTALVGASGHASGGFARAGAAYVFVRSGGAWNLQTELTGTGAAADDWAGTAVALSGDVAVVGAPGRSAGGAAYAGAAFVFRRSGGSWQQEAELTAAAGAGGDEFGCAVAVDGDTALAGARNHSVNGLMQAGQVYVFTRSGGWYLEAQLGAPDPAPRAGFGAALAFEGATAVIGAGGASPGGEDAAGAAYIYDRSGNNWMLSAELTDPGATAGDWFGSAVALDGDTAMVGAWGATVAGKLEAGSAYVFGRSTAGWTRRSAVTAATPATNDKLGWAVAIDGQTTLAGAPGDTVAGQIGAGAALVHGLVPAPWVTLSASPRVVKTGRTVTLAGTVANAVAGADTVRVWRKQGSKLTLLGTTRQSAGSFGWSTRPKKAGTWVFVTTYDAGGQTFRSPSATVTVKAPPKKPKKK